MSNLANEMLNRTRDGLDCIAVENYIDIDKSLSDVMEEIQMAFQYHALPFDAMAIFSDPKFHHDVFRHMDEEDFEEYLCDRYPDLGPDFAS